MWPLWNPILALLSTILARFPPPPLPSPFPPPAPPAEEVTTSRCVLENPRVCWCVVVFTISWNGVTRFRRKIKVCSKHDFYPVFWRAGGAVALLYQRRLALCRPELYRQAETAELKIDRRHICGKCDELNPFYTHICV